MNSRIVLSRVLAALLLAAVLATPAAAQTGSDVTNEGIWGAGAALSTLVYGPAKIGFAIGGSVVSGLAWCFTLGNDDIARPIFKSAVGGDYVVLPKHLDGSEKIQFVGDGY